MRKLKLELEELRVESFDTDAAGPGGGTVDGAEATEQYCLTARANACSAGGGCSEYTCYPPSCPAASCDDCQTYYCAPM